jgi:hypothetical protein
MTESFFEGVYRNWIWIGGPLMLISATALGLLIAGTVRMVRKAQLFRVPLAERQEVGFAEAEQVVLSVEGPRFSTRFGNLAYELRAGDGTRVEGRPVLLRTETAAVSTVRLEILTYDIPRPGRYVLRIGGLGAPQADDARHAIVFGRPYLGRLVAHILGMILSASVFIGSLVFFLLRLLETGPGA